MLWCVWNTQPSQCILVNFDTYSSTRVLFIAIAKIHSSHLYSVTPVLRHPNLPFPPPLALGPTAEPGGQAPLRPTLQCCTRATIAGSATAMTRFAEEGVRPLPCIAIAIVIAHDLWLTPDPDKDSHREPPTLRLHYSTTQPQPAIGESGASALCLLDRPNLIKGRRFFVEEAKLGQATKYGTPPPCVKLSHPCGGPRDFTTTQSALADHHCIH